MKIIISLLISLVALYATPVWSEEITCTIVFEYTGTEEQITEVVDFFLTDLKTDVIVQIHGYEEVAYCASMDECIIVPGSVQVVPPVEKIKIRDDT
jgi:hypothetical protein